MKLGLDAAVNATSATVLDPQHAPKLLRVVTDTRTICAGDTFLALRGEQFDGHDYVAQAVAKGAAAVVIDDASAHVAGTAALVVADTRAAYMALAGLARAQFNGRVIAITGSSGKTTTKELLAQLLQVRHGERVLASVANENNELGVSKLLLGASNRHHDVLVVEMGARHFNDIAPLVRIAKPEIGVLTNIGDAHVEIMGSRERLAQTKWELFSLGARAVLNARDEVSHARAAALPSEPHWFAACDPDEPAPSGRRRTVLVGASLLTDADGARRTERAVEVRLPGAHNRANLAAAIAAALEAGVELDAIGGAIPSLELPPGRYESIPLPSGVRLIYDAYNANTAGMIAALDAFAKEPGVRHIAVLGSMAELGDEATHLHECVGAHAGATNVEYALVGGDYGDQLARGANTAGLSWERIIRFATNEEAAEWLREHTRAGDVVLLKGSRKYKLEQIVEELRR